MKRLVFVLTLVACGAADEGGAVTAPDVLALDVLALDTNADDAGGSMVSDTVSDTVNDTGGEPDTALADDAQSSSDAPPSDAHHAADDGVTPNDTAETALSFCQQFAKASCALQAACPLPGLPLAPDCEAAAYAECGGDAVASAVVKGTATLVGEDACLDALATLSCDAWRAAITSMPEAVPACDAVVQGSVADGSACRGDAECVSGRCEVGASCPGTCAEAWTQPHAPGDACGAATADFAFCQEPLVCDDEGECAVRGDLGAACHETAPCHPWLTCYAGTCALYRAPGEPCFTTAQCDPRLPGARLVCSGGVCTSGPGVGAPCTEFVCGTGYCDTTALPPTCVQAPSAGEPCAGGGLCDGDLRCYGGNCVAPQLNGDACSTPAQCQSYRCVAGVCLGPGAAPCPFE